MWTTKRCPKHTSGALNVASNLQGGEATTGFPSSRAPRTPAGAWTPVTAANTQRSHSLLPGEQLHWNLQTAFPIQSRTPHPSCFHQAGPEGQGEGGPTCHPPPSREWCQARETWGNRGPPLHVESLVNAVPGGEGS